MIMNKNGYDGSQVLFVDDTLGNVIQANTYDITAAPRQKATNKGISMLKSIFYNITEIDAKIDAETVLNIGLMDESTKTVSDLAKYNKTYNLQDDGTPTSYLFENYNEKGGNIVNGITGIMNLQIERFEREKNQKSK